MKGPVIYGLDMEGVLVPEIWIEVSKKTRVPDLRLTTRDIPDYDALMKRRLGILRKEGIRLHDIQKVIGTMKPLPGARAFLDRLRAQGQVIILSDTYYEFAMPLMAKLGYPTLFCNWLSTDKKGFISGYHLRQQNGKEKAIRRLREAGFSTVAAGDSYNDVTMLKAADRGVFFNPPARISGEFPQFPITTNYPQLFKALTAK
jgi:phosphoserine/homoserine phosphotransferase